MLAVPPVLEPVYGASSSCWAFSSASFSAWDFVCGTLRVSMPPQSMSDCTSVLTDSLSRSRRVVVVAGNERVEDTVPFDGAAANAVGGECGDAARAQ